MNRKERAEQFRRNVIRLGGKNIKAKALKTLDDKTILPRKEWGYRVEFIFKDGPVCSFGASWYEAWKGAYLAIEFIEKIEKNNQKETA